MLRFAPLATAALVLASPAHADGVRDILLLPSEDQVWIALEGAPSGLEVEASSGRLILTLTDFAPDAREIRPRSGPLQSISIRPQGELVLTGAMAISHAELREGGVLLSFSGARAYEVGASAYPEPQGAFRIQPGPPSRQASPEAAGAPVQAVTPPSTAELIQSAEPPSLTSGDAQPGLRRDTPDIQAASPDSLTEIPEAVEAAPSPDRPAEIAEALEAAPAPEPPPGPCDGTAEQIASSPWDLDGLAAHAGCMAEIGEVVNAAGLYERVLAFEPDHFQAALGLARLREAEGRRQDAARLFDAAARSALTDGQALVARQAAERLRAEDG